MLPHDVHQESYRVSCLFGSLFELQKSFANPPTDQDIRKHLELLNSLCGTLPVEWQPTTAQLVQPHDWRIDLIAIADLRDRLVKGGPDVTNLFFKEFNEQVPGLHSNSFNTLIIWGEDMTNGMSWEFSEGIMHRWGWMLGTYWLHRTNFWRSHRRLGPVSPLVAYDLPLVNWPKLFAQMKPMILDYLENKVMTLDDADEVAKMKVRMRFVLAQKEKETMQMVAQRRCMAMKGEMNGHMNRPMNGYIDGQMNDHMRGRVNGHMNWQMNGHADTANGMDQALGDPGAQANGKSVDSIAQNADLPLQSVENGINGLHVDNGGNVDMNMGMDLNDANGVNGNIGLNGNDGMNGTEGLTGFNGMNDTNGMNGMTGTNGMEGLNGLGLTNMNGINGMPSIDQLAGISAATPMGVFQPQPPPQPQFTDNELDFSGLPLQRSLPDDESMFKDGGEVMNLNGPVKGLDFSNGNANMNGNGLTNGNGLVDANDHSNGNGFINCKGSANAIGNGTLINNSRRNGNSTPLDGNVNPLNGSTPSNDSTPNSRHGSVQRTLLPRPDTAPAEGAAGGSPIRTSRRAA
jgi:hypothetical protein